MFLIHSWEKGLSKSTYSLLIWHLYGHTPLSRQIQLRGSFSLWIPLYFEGHQTTEVCARVGFLNHWFVSFDFPRYRQFRSQMNNSLHFFHLNGSILLYRSLILLFNCYLRVGDCFTIYYWATSLWFAVSLFTKEAWWCHWIVLDVFTCLVLLITLSFVIFITAICF